MKELEPERPVLYRADDDWMQVVSSPRRPLDADLFDDAPDEDDAPPRYWTLRRVIWIIAALLALLALLASLIAPFIQPLRELPAPLPDIRDLVTVIQEWLI
jgi:hypothetical protein